MIKDIIKTGDPFGIVLKDDKGVKSIGCSVKIIRVLKEHPTGEYDIIVQGQQCFRIKDKVQENDQLWIGYVTYLEDQESAPILAYFVETGIERRYRAPYVQESIV